MTLTRPQQASLKCGESGASGRKPALKALPAGMGPSRELRSSPHFANQQTVKGPFLESKVLSCMELQVTSDLGAVNPIVDLVKELARELRATTEDEYDIGLALHEALVNAIKHGCKGKKGLKVQVSLCCLDPPGLSIAVRDPGEGFDPASQPDPTDRSQLLRPHGRGIFLIRRLMDRVRFDLGGSRIHMEKRLSQSRRRGK